MHPIETYAEAINEALAVALESDPRVLCYGLGVPDPKGVFGTTLGLQQRFGKDRVFDMPTAENGMTGVAIGAALTGLRPVMMHQRVDFALLSMDQIVNNAAKWHYMFGGLCPVPLTIRMIIGRGWGQGPTHSQSLQAWFAHIPGLKVVMPAFPADAKGLLLSAIFDDNPVIYLDHRWLHQERGAVPAGDFRTPIGKASVVREGTDVTLVAMSIMNIEALHAADHLNAQGVRCEVLDLRSVAPLDWDAVFQSVKKTGRLLALDTGSATCSISSEVIARVSMECMGSLKSAPRRIALPDAPSPTSPTLSRGFFATAVDIVREIGLMLDRDLKAGELAAQKSGPHDVPGEWFKGPF
jgi:pyruvate dehydrogenase E1 component beta subunit